MASVNAPIQDSRGNRLVYRPSQLQEPKLKAAMPEKAPPPRERTMIVPLEALNVPAEESTPASAPAKPEAAKSSQPSSSSRTSPSLYLALALILALAVWALLSR